MYLKGRYLLFLLLALAACDTTTREARRMVKHAELLADTLSDSTARLIDSVLRMPANFSERERMDMALLQAEALFGDRGDALSPIMDDDFLDDKGNLSTSPELERAATYYAKKKQYAKASHAALYSGVVQQHYNEKESAMRSFKEAEQYGKIVDDSLTMARAEYWMGKMLYDDYMEAEAISILKTADLNFGTHFGERALVQNVEAVAHIVLRQFDDAEQCLKRSLEYAERGHFEKARLKALNNYAVLFRFQGKYNHALECLELVEKEIGVADMPLLYLNKGIIFNAMNNTDSTYYYYKLVEPFLFSPDIKEETKVSFYNSISCFAESQGDIATALQYLKQGDLILGGLRDKIEQRNLYSVQRKYNYENLQNTLNGKIIQRHRIVFIFGFLLFVSTVIIVVLQFRHKQLLKTEEEMKQQLDTMKHELRQTVKSSYLEQELSSRLRLIIHTHRTSKQANDPKKEWNPIVLQVMNGKSSVFEAVEREIEKVYPGLYLALCQKFPYLNETETKVCLLSCCDLSNTEMSEILGLSLNTINKNRSKVRGKLNLKPERMQEQLREALTN